MKGTKIGLQFKAMAVIGCIMAATTAFSVQYFSRRTEDLILHHHSARLLAIEKSFTFNAEYGLLVRDPVALDRLVQGVQAHEDILAAFVLDLDGNPVSTLPTNLGA